MSSPQALAHFLDIDDIDVASAVLGEAANGDMQPLLEIIEAKVDEMVTNIQEENPVAKIDIPEITPQEEMTDTQESLSDSDIKPLFDDNEDNTDTHITQAEQPLTLNEKKPQANTQISIPSNLPDMLRIGFDIKQRITAKSLSESLKIFGADISQSLARYIIEEGGYGGAPPDTHRITSKDMLEKLITDIAKEESLKSFVKIYLAKVNNDLKSMLSGG